MDHLPSAPEERDRAGWATGDEAERYHAIIRGETLPDGVRGVNFRFGEDSTGAPAVWIVIIADEDLRPSQEKLTALRNFSNKVRTKIHKLEMERWPYVTIETEQ